MSIFSRTQQGSQEWLTTADVARKLRMAPRSVRRLAANKALEARITTRSGLRMFWKPDVDRFDHQRSDARLDRLAIARPAPAGELRQLALFGRARLKLVTLSQGEAESCPLADVPMSESFRKSSGVR